MASKYSIETIFKAIDRWSNPVKLMEDANKSFNKSLRTDFARTQRHIDKMSERFKDFAKNGAMLFTGALTVGIGYAMTEGIRLASDLIEVQNVVDTTFGKSSGIINDWSKNAINQFGLSQLQAKKYTSTLGAMMKSSGLSGESIVKMSTDLSGLVGDFASFYNLDHETAFEKIRSGISGETEPLKQLGINMSVANMEAFALTQGISKQWKNMNQAEQVMLRYKYLMSTTKDAQGDFAKTLETSWANQQRVLQTKFNEKLAQTMSKLIPMLIEGAKWLNNFLDKIDTDKLASNIEAGAKSVVSFAKGLYNLIKVLRPYLIVFAVFLAMWKLYWVGMAAATFIAPLVKFIQIIIAIAKVKGIWIAVQWALNAALTANPIGLIIMGVAALIAGIILLIVYQKQVIKFFKEWGDTILGVISIFNIFMAPLMLTISFIKQLVSSWNDVKEAFKSEGIIGGIIEIGKVIVDAILAPVEGILKLLSMIPVIGGTFKDMQLNVGNFKNNLFQTQAPINSSDRNAVMKQETNSKNELLIKDTTGKAELKKDNPYNPYVIMKKYSGAF